MSTESSAIPIFVLGSERRAALCTRVSECVQAWLQEWGVRECAGLHTEAHSVRELGNDPLSGLSTAYCGRMSLGGQSLLVVITEEMLSRLIGLPRHIYLLENETAPRARMLIDQLVTTLARRLGSVARLPVNEVELCAMHSAPASRRELIPPQAWIIQTDDREALSICRIAFSASLVNFLAPPQVKADGALDTRTLAIAPAAIDVEAVLGDVELTIGDIASLSVDDVVVLEQSLSATARLVTKRGATIGPVELGRSDTQRAVVFRP